MTHRRALAYVAGLIVAVAGLPLVSASTVNASDPGANGAIVMGTGAVGPGFRKLNHDLDWISFGDFTPRGVFTTGISYRNPGQPVFSSVVASPDGRAIEPIVQIGPGRIIDLSWSPDGGRFAALFERSNETTHIAVHTVASGETTTLFSGGEENYIETVSWQPTGNLIAFSWYGDVWTVDANTKATAQVTHRCTWTAGAVTGCDRNQPSYRNPDWSPDGRALAVDLFQSSGFDHDGVGTVNAATGAFTEVYRLPDALGINPAMPVWSPDGTMIAFQMAPDGKAGTYTVPFGGGTATRRGVYGIMDWQACDGSCPTFGFPPPKRTSISVRATVRPAKVIARGAVSPPPGKDIVGLSLRVRRPGYWRFVAGRDPQLAPDGSYVASFPHPKGSRCQITAHYPGSERFLRSMKTIQFAC